VGGPHGSGSYTASEAVLHWHLRLSFLIEKSVDQVIVIPKQKCEIAFKFPNVVPRTTLKDWNFEPEKEGQIKVTNVGLLQISGHGEVEIDGRVETPISEKWDLTTKLGYLLFRNAEDIVDASVTGHLYIAGRRQKIPIDIKIPQHACKRFHFGVYR
jgi:hypothetical protein